MHDQIKFPCPCCGHLVFDFEPGWRPLNPDQDKPEKPSRGISYGDSYPWPDTTVLYYWRSTYWRRVVG